MELTIKLDMLTRKLNSTDSSILLHVQSEPELVRVVGPTADLSPMVNVPVV